MSWLNDLRYAIRSLRRSSGVVGFVVVTLATGIAGTTSMFSLVNAVVLEPLPFHDPDELVTVWERRPQQGRDRNPVSPADFFDWRDNTGVFDDLVAYTGGGANLTGNGEPERVTTAFVSARFFELFGVKPLLGRTFSTGELVPGSNRVVILSHGLWTRRFGNDPDVVSTAIRLDGVEHTVIGVMPASFKIARERDLWSPLALEPERRSARGWHYLLVYGRLADGRTLDEARVEMENLAARLETQYPEVNTGHTTRVESLKDELLGDTRAGLWMLFAVSILVLLICCANVANVWLARGASREREVAIAAAMGAGALRLLRPLVLEGAVVVAAAGSLGLALSMLIAEPLVNSVMPGTSVSPSIEMVLAATLASGAALVLFGLFPALRVSSLDLESALRSNSTVSGSGPKAMKKILVVAEVALALILVITSALIVKSFERLSAVDPGFRAEGVLSVALSLPESSYPEAFQRSTFYDALTARFEALPGVSSVGSTNILPLSGDDSGRFFSIEGRAPSAPGESPNARVRAISPGYFRTMGIPLLRGRDVSVRDDADAPFVVVVNQRLVDNYFPDEDPLRGRLRFGEDDFDIVGVVGDVRHVSLDVEPKPHVYFASAQQSGRSVTFVLRVSGDPLDLADAARAQVWAVDGEQPVSRIERLEDIELSSVAEPRKLKNTMTLFAALALLLAAGGIYSVMSYVVVQRSRDLAMRMALGARIGDVTSLVVREGMSLVGAGIVVALVVAAISSKLVARFLFQVETLDFESWFWSVLILVASGIVATLVPAQRTARIDLVASLRAD